MNRIVRTLFVGFGSFFAVAGAFAGTVTLSKSDASGVYALLEPDVWQGEQNGFPDPAADYYVGDGKEIHTKPDSDMVFSGRSLILGDADANHYATFAFRANGGDRVLTFSGEGGLVLGRGAIDNWNGCCTAIKGNVSVASTDARQFFVYSGSEPNADSQAGVNCQFEGSLSSGANAKLLFCSTKDAKNVLKASYRLLCDASRYLGRIAVAQSSQGVPSSRKRVTLELGDIDFAGTLEMATRTTLEPCKLGGVARLCNLELKSGSALSLRWDSGSRQWAGLQVDGSLSLVPPVEVRPSRFNAAYGDGGFSVPLLKAPQGAELNAADFVFVAAQESDVDDFISPAVTLEVAKDEDGRDVLWAKSLPVLRSSGDDGKAADGTTTCSFCHDPNSPASNWPDGNAADPAYDYFSAYSIRTPHNDTLSHAVFPGHSLTLKPSSADKTFAIRCFNVTVDDFRVDVSSRNVEFDNSIGGDKTTNSAFASYGTVSVKGKLKIRSVSSGSKRLYLYPTHKCLIRIDSDISGNGNIEARMTGNTANTYCSAELAGDNSRWSGRLIASKKPSDSLSYSRIVFREAKNLGGPMPSFTHNALELGGGTGRLRPLQSVTIDEPTRGIYVSGDNCRFEVNDGIVFGVRQRICYSGCLTKTGAGTLALGGGKPLFTSSASSVPVEGKNRLAIEEGSLMPLSGEAFDGLALSFAQDTGIKLAVPKSVDDGAGRWGMALTNEYSSISLPEGGVQVSFADGEEPPGRRFSVPVCTVRGDMAASVRGKLVLASRNFFPGLVSEVSERNNGDGTVTFSVDTFRSGLIMCIR